MDLEKRTKVKVVKPVRLTLRCAVAGCAGSMQFTGSAFTQIDTTYDHRCSVCGAVEGLINQKFPRIEFID